MAQHSKVQQRPLGRTGGGFALTAPPPRPGAATHPALQHIFNPTRDADFGMPYHEQSDLTMYTPDALAARASLREHPAVIDAIRRFAKLYQTDADGRVSRGAYCRVHLPVVQALMGSQLVLAEVRSVIEEDWLSDCAGEECLSPARLFDALFEMADLWCPGLAVEEYVAFLDALADRIAPALATPLRLEED